VVELRATGRAPLPSISPQTGWGAAVVGWAARSWPRPVATCPCATPARKGRGGSRRPCPAAAGQLGKRPSHSRHRRLGPGLVRSGDGHVHEAPALGWRDVPIRELIRMNSQDLNVPSSWARRGSGHLRGHLRGSGRGTTDFICIWGEGGLGAGIVVDGRLLAGSAGYAGEVGMSPSIPRRPVPLWCARAASSRCGRGGPSSSIGPGPAGRHGGARGLDRAADRGDQAALSALAESGRGLGIGIAGLVNIFNRIGSLWAGCTLACTRTSGRPSCASSKKRRCRRRARWVDLVTVRPRSKRAAARRGRASTRSAVERSGYHAFAAGTCSERRD